MNSGPLVSSACIQSSWIVSERTFGVGLFESGSSLCAALGCWCFYTCLNLEQPPLHVLTSHNSPFQVPTSPPGRQSLWGWNPLLCPAGSLCGVWDGAEGGWASVRWCRSHWIRFEWMSPVLHLCDCLWLCLDKRFKKKDDLVACGGFLSKRQSVNIVT